MVNMLKIIEPNVCVSWAECAIVQECNSSTVRRVEDLKDRDQDIVCNGRTQLKSDLEDRLPGKHVRTALLQLTSEPRVLLRQRESDGRCLKPVKIPKEEKFKKTDNFSIRWADEAKIENIKKKHFPKRLFDTDSCSVKLSKLCQAQWTEQHRHDVKHMTKLTEVIKTTKLKDYHRDSRQKHDLFGKEIKVARNAGSNSEKHNTGSLPRHKKPLADKEPSDYLKNQTKDELKEKEIWKIQNVSATKNSEKTHHMSKLLSEQISPGVITIPVQLNIAQLNINFTQMGPAQANRERRKVELPKNINSPKRRDIIQTVLKSKNKHVELKDIAPKSSNTDQDRYDLSVKKKRRKRSSTEVILNSPKRQRTDKSTSFHKKDKYIKKNILKKFRTYFGESRDSSEDDEDRSLIKKRMRRKRDSVEYYDSGCGIDEDQSSPGERPHKRVHWAPNIFQYINPVALNSAKQNVEERSIRKCNTSQNTEKTYIIPRNDKNGSSVTTKERPTKDVPVEQLDLATKQVEEHVLDSDIPSTGSAVADNLGEENLQSTDSLTSESIIVLDSDTDSCENNRIDLVVADISEIGDETVSPEPGDMSIVTSPVSEETESVTNISQSADNIGSISPVTDCNAALDPSESCEQVISTIDNNDKVSVLDISPNECRKETTITKEDPKEADDGNAYAPDTSTNVQNLSDVMLEDDTEWMNDIYQLLQMGLDENCEILSDGNTVHIPLNGPAQNVQTTESQKTEESNINQLNIVQSSQGDSSRELDIITPEVALDVPASTRDAREEDSVELEAIREFIQTGMAPMEKSTLPEAENERVPETVMINDSSSTEIVCTGKTQVPKTTLPRLRVLTSGELGARWCPTPVPPNPVESSKTNPLPNSATPNDSITLQPPGGLTSAVSSVQQNLETVHSETELKNRLIIILNKITESVRYLRYLRKKNDLDKNISNKHIREKQMNQNLIDFMQSAGQFRTEFLQLGTLLHMRSLNTLVKRILPHLNSTEMQDMPLGFQEFTTYWRFDPGSHVVPNAINENFAKTWTNNSSTANTSDMVVNTTIATTGLHYNNVTMTNNIAPTISSNVLSQYKIQPTKSVSSQQFQIARVNNTSIRGYHNPQGRSPRPYKHTLPEEHSLHLPSPVTEYNEQMKINQAVMSQDSSSMLTDPNRQYKNVRWHYARVIANSTMPQSSVPQTPLSSPWISPPIPVNKSSNQVERNMINPAQQTFHPMYNTQSAFPTLYSALVQRQPQQTQVKNIQHAADLRMNVAGNVQPMTSQTVIQPSVTCTQQTACTASPKQSQLDMQGNSQQSRETKTQHIPVMQTSFVNVILPPTQAQDVSRITSGNVGINNSGTTINNVPANNHHSAILQHGVQTVNTSGMWETAMRNENTNNYNGRVPQTSSSLTGCFSILQTMMLRNQIQMCLFLPVREMQKYMQRSEITQMNSHRAYLSEFLRTYKGFANFPLAVGACSVPVQTQNNEKNISYECGQIKVAEVNASKQNQQRKRRKSRKKSEMSTHRETRFMKSGECETQSTEMINATHNDSNISGSSVEDTREKPNNGDADISNSQHDTQEVSDTTVLQNISAFKEQVKLSPVVKELSLKDTEKRDNVPNIQIILEVGKDTSSEEVPAVGRSLPIISVATSGTTSRVLYSKNIDSLPVLDTTTAKESNNSESGPIANSDKQPVTSLPLSEEICEEPSQLTETSTVESEKEKRTDSSLNAKELIVSRKDETEKAVLDLLVRTGDKPIECISLADTDLSPSIRVEDLSPTHIESLETSIETLSLKTTNSQSTEILSQTTSDLEFIELDGESSCEFQPNILSVRSISLSTFSQLKERSSEIELLELPGKSDFGDELDIGSEDSIDIKDEFVNQVKKEESDEEQRAENNKKNDKICLNCSRVSTVVCSRCLKASYCTKQCQESHWEIHFSSCKRHPLSIFCGHRLSSSKEG